jgi:SpoVK/Ycf46/Vps4 family AAA+-type ATPase
MMQDLKDLALIVDSHIPLVLVESWDETQVMELMALVAEQTGKGLFTWSATQGLRVSGLALVDDDEALEVEGPEQVLTIIKQHRAASFYVLFDFHPYLQSQPLVVRHVKDIALGHRRLGHTLIFVSHQLELPAEVRRYAARFDLTPPNKAQLKGILREELRDWMRDHAPKRPEVEPEALQAVLANVAGSPALDARRLLRAAIRNDGAINQADITPLVRAKFALLDMEGMLRLVQDIEDLDSVGGLDNLKQWLSVRGSQLTSAAVDRPKGMLLTGVQGTGKSLAAKAVAAAWRLPLLHLDMGALFNKFIGETEKNLRRCLQQAERMAPCVLWMDEIEKSLAQSGNDDATSQRVLGTLLTWMAEREAAVFLVATANDISCLPPELLRKGRFDEIFFVDLPAEEERCSILRIHLQRRGHNIDHFDIDALSTLCEGFSGAEIEQAIVAALHLAMTDDRQLCSALIGDELRRTRPLSVVMAEQVAALRHWARDRAVVA